MWDRSAIEQTRTSVLRYSLFKPPSEWDAANYARNSTPQARFAMEALNRDEWFARFIAQCNEPELNVIDLGCGNGAITAQLARENPQVHFTGVDLSQHMITKAKEDYNLPNLDFVCGDATDKALPERLGKKFTAVLSFSTIHWIEDQHQLVENIRLMSTPHAGLCLMLYPRDHFLWDTIQQVAQSDTWKIYFPSYSTPYYGVKNELTALLAEHGIESTSSPVFQEYQNDGRTQLRNYLSGITPIYAPLIQALAKEQKSPTEIETMKCLFLDEIVAHLVSGKAKTFVEHEDGSSRFNYERVECRGLMNPDMVLSCTPR